MLFTIKDIENLSGIKAHTIRIWEQRYSLIKPKRSDTNIRFYTNEELRKILNIALLNKYGYKISQIDKMSPEAMLENVLSLSDAEAKVDVIINRLLESMMSFESETFEKVLNDSISTLGIEKTLLQIIFPFLDKVGVLWLTSHIKPAQEHLASNIIRQKILVGIDAVSTKKTSSKKIVLFLPEGEYHEISLLLVYYLFKKKGIPVIYLGASTPFDDLKNLTTARKPDYLYTHLTTAGPHFHFDKFIATLHKDFSKFPIVISGRLINAYEKKIPQNIFFKRSLGEVQEFINSL